MRELVLLAAFGSDFAGVVAAFADDGKPLDDRQQKIVAVEAAKPETAVWKSPIEGEWAAVAINSDFVGAPDGSAIRVPLDSVLEQPALADLAKSSLWFGDLPTTVRKGDVKLDVRGDRFTIDVKGQAGTSDMAFVTEGPNPKKFQLYLTSGTAESLLGGRVDGDRLVLYRVVHDPVKAEMLEDFWSIEFERMHSWETEIP